MEMTLSFQGPPGRCDHAPPPPSTHTHTGAARHEYLRRKYAPRIAGLVAHCSPSALVHRCANAVHRVTLLHDAIEALLHDEMEIVPYATDDMTREWSLALLR